MHLSSADLREQRFVSSVNTFQNASPPSAHAPFGPAQEQNRLPFCHRLHILPPTLMFPRPASMMNSIYKDQTLFSLLRRTGVAV